MSGTMVTSIKNKAVNLVKFPAVLGQKFKIFHHKTLKN